MTNNLGSTTMRNIPGCCHAGGRHHFVVADNGNAGPVGGTSAAAPLWAAFTALVNQQAAANCGPTVGFLNPAIYSIGQSLTYTNEFHDIITGNDTNSVSPDRFFALPGYDLCTGWGTPGGLKLINALSATAPPTGLLSIQVSPFSGSTLLNSTTQAFFVTVQSEDFATVSASVPGITNITFWNNGQPPDLVSNDDIYSASIQIPGLSYLSRHDRYRLG